jgi:hypothetical protein
MSHPRQSSWVWLISTISVLGVIGSTIGFLMSERRAGIHLGAVVGGSAITVAIAGGTVSAITWFAGRRSVDAQQSLIRAAGSVAVLTGFHLKIDQTNQVQELLETAAEDVALDAGLSRSELALCLIVMGPDGNLSDSVFCDYGGYQIPTSDQDQVRPYIRESIDSSRVKMVQLSAHGGEVAIVIPLHSPATKQGLGAIVLSSTALDVSDDRIAAIVSTLINWGRLVMLMFGVYASDQAGLPA